MNFTHTSRYTRFSISVLLLLLCWLALPVSVIGQCDPEPRPSVACGEAPVLCGEGACYYTTLELSTEGPHGGWCGANTAIHNPQYFRFTALDTFLRFEIQVFDCTGEGGCGLQSAILDACPWDNGNVLSCNPGTGPGGTMILLAVNVEIGREYYLVVDGCAGHTCGYAFEKIEGTSASPPVSVTIETEICSGLYTHDGIDYPAGEHLIIYERPGKCDSTVLLIVDVQVTVTLEGTPYCIYDGDLVTLNAHVSGSFGPFEYQWWTGSTASSEVVNSPQSGGLTVTDAEGCAAVVLFEVNERPSIVVTPDNLGLCEKSSGLLEIVPIVSGGSGGYTYLWTTPSGQEVADVLSVSEIGTYHLLVRDDAGCEGETEFEVVSFANPSVEFENTGPFCADEIGAGIEVTALFSQNVLSYTLSDNWQDPPFVIVAGGTYEITLYSESCTTTQAITILETEPPVADFSADVCRSHVKLTHGEQIGTTYTWNFGDGNSSGTIQPQHTYLESGDYTITLIVENACGTETFEQQVSILTVSSPPLEPENCDNATDLGILGSIAVECASNPVDAFHCTSGSNFQSGTSPMVSACSGSRDPVAWFKFQTDNQANFLNIHIASDAFEMPAIQLFRSLNGACSVINQPAGLTRDQLSCAAGNGGKLVASLTQVERNSTYFLAVSAVNSSGGTFDLCINVIRESIVSCVTDAEVRMLEKSHGGSLDGPFHPGEEVRVCLNVNRFDVSTGAQNCQWLQGVVPIFGNGWDPGSFDSNGQPYNATMNALPFPAMNVHNGGQWEWWTAVAYHTGHCNVSIGDIDGDGVIDFCHALLDPDCQGGGTTQACCGPCWGSTGPDDPGVGTLLPPGWFTSGVDGTCGGMAGWPAVDWGDGNTCNGPTGPWSFCFDLRVREDLGPGQDDLSIGMFTVADGEVGSWTGGPSVCGNDIPVLRRFNTCPEAQVADPLVLPAQCTGQPVSLPVENPDVEYWTWTVSLPPGTELSSLNGVTECGVLETGNLYNHGNELALVVFQLQGFRGGQCPFIVQELVVPVNPQSITSLSSLAVCTALDSIVIEPVITVPDDQLMYLWEDGSDLSYYVIYNPQQGDMVSVTVTDIITGCVSIQTGMIHDDGPGVSADPEVALICDGESALINITVQGGTAPFAFVWTVPGVPEPVTLEPDYSVPGVYSVQVTDAYACVTEIFYEVQLDDTPVHANMDYEISSGTVTFTNLSAGAVSYHWDFGDGNTSDEVNPEHTYEDDGTFTVQLIATGACTSDTIWVDIQIIFVSVSGPVADQKLIVIPNPNSGEFMIQGFTMSPGAEIVMIDMLGRSAAYQWDTAGSFRLIQPVPGVYTLVIREGVSVSVARIVVQR